MIHIKKYEVVKSKIEFNEIIKTKRFKTNRLFTIYIKERKIASPRFGLAISKKVGNAVTRNKLKRQLRVIIDDLKSNFSKSYDYIIMIKKECNNASFKEKHQSLAELIKEIQ